MTRLAPATLELRVAGVAVGATGVVGSARILAEGRSGDLRSTILGLAGCLVALWVLGAPRVVRTAIRLALPVRTDWTVEDPGATVARVVVTQVVPVCAIALVAGALGAGRLAGAPALAGGALIALGLGALAAAHRMRGVERSIGRRFLRRPGWGTALGRRSLFMEPRAPGGHARRPPATPWPAHRPPPRPQTSAIEMDPANPPARHAVGVTPRPRIPPREPGA